jgi:hypothetical protein
VNQVASERSIEPRFYSTPRSLSRAQPVATNGRAVLHFATQSLLSWNDLVWHYLVCRTTRVLDRVSGLILLFTDGGP